MQIAFIGLGVMGYPMAGHLARAGHQLTVYNRHPAKAAQWVNEYGGQMAATPYQAAQHADVVLLCVSNDEAVREVCTGPDGVLHAMRPGRYLVDHTTSSRDMAQELAQACANRAVHFLDAPVSGGQAGAQQGRLTIMVGGEEDALAAVRVVLACYGQRIECMGPHGHGQLSKMVNQLLIAGVVQGLAEGVRFAREAGLDMELLVQVLKGGAAQSWQLEQRAETMARGEFDFGFAVDWMRKDLGYCLQQAGRWGLSLPLASMVDERYARLQAQGDGRLDTSSLIRLLAPNTQE